MAKSCLGGAVHHEWNKTINKMHYLTCLIITALGSPVVPLHSPFFAADAMYAAAATAGGPHLLTRKSVKNGATKNYHRAVKIDLIRLNISL